jgi:RNA polymerase sigma factor (sigma-70 family)
MPHRSPLSSRMVTELSDAELVDLTIQGDRHAYGELYSRHRHTALRYVMSRSTYSATWDDHVAEAFTKILTSINSGYRPVNFRAYLFTSLRHCVITDYRKWTARTAPYKKRDDPPSPSPEAIVLRALTMRPTLESLSDRWREALESLSDRWRDALWLSAVEGWTVNELPKVFGLSENACAALTYRARKALKVAYVTHRAAMPPGS